MAEFILSLDQGTTSSRAIIFDHAGKITAMAQKEFRQIFPKPGWVEHDPMEIWSTQLGVAAEAIYQGGHCIRKTWPPLASPTSGRPPLSGTALPANLFIMPLCGRTGGPPFFVMS